MGMKVVVGGVLSLSPFSPGTAWDRLHYVLGLQALGHQVYFVEEVEPAWCRDRKGHPCPYEESVNREIFSHTLAAFDLLERSCQLYAGGELTTGLDRAGLADALHGADLLVNISGHVKSELVLECVGRRLYLDQDPVYTQLWHTEYGVDLGLGHHDVLFTMGTNIGTDESDIPTGGLCWHHTLPPVVLDYWPVPGADEGRKRFTTVASWGRYADLIYEGRPFGSKRAEFHRFAELASQVDQELELALGASGRHVEDVERLRQAGWTIRHAEELADVFAYQRYLAGSRAEIGITKGAYVEGRAGWIGDRSCHYLASGKPVLLQSTGLERTVPSGRGLITFRNIEDAAAGIEAINGDYPAHRRVARELAEEVFDARTVLTELVEAAMAAGAGSPGRIVP